MPLLLCGSVDGHASNGKCNYCEIGWVCGGSTGNTPTRAGVEGCCAASEGRQHRGSCKHFRTCGGKYTVPTIQGSFLIPSDEEDIRQQMAQVASFDGASRRRMIGGPSDLVLATGRDFYEDGVSDEEKLCMPSSSSESSFAGDNLDEAEQVAAAQLTTGGSTIVTRSMARRASRGRQFELHVFI